MARIVVIGGKGAYGVNAEDTKYYLVEWTADPQVIEEDGVIMVADQLMQVFAGNLVCNGKLLNNVHQAKFWNTVGGIEVTGRMQNILNPYLGVRAVSADTIAQNHPIKLNAYAHDFMMDEISRRQMLDDDEDADNESSSDSSEDDEVNAAGIETYDEGKEDSEKE
jgi:hypothetical protein